MSRHLKLIATVAVVLVALSGFSPAKSGGRGGSSSGKGSSSGGSSSGKSGGGCSSSSSSSHNNSSGSYDDDSGYKTGSDGGYRRGSRYNNSTGKSGSSHSSSSSSPTGTVDRCAAEEGTEAKAVVRVRNPNGERKTYRVRVDFRDTADTLVDTGSARVTVSANGSGTVDVRMEHPERLRDVAECEVSSVS